jgi:hypothetical protein
MAKIFVFKSASDSDLAQIKLALVQRMHIPTNAVRASCVRQFLTCGKANCRCQQGKKHGPFHYLVQCLGVGSVRKFLLKTPAHREQARASVAAYAVFQAQLEELSQLNAELLRRGESLTEL